MLSGDGVRCHDYNPRPLPCSGPLGAGLSQGQRKIMSKGMVSNGATVLDFLSGPGGGSSPESPLPNACQLLMSAARSSSKGGGSATGSAGKRKRATGVGSSSVPAKKVRRKFWRSLFLFYVFSVVPPLFLSVLFSLALFVFCSMVKCPPYLSWATYGKAG